VIGIGDARLYWRLRLLESCKSEKKKNLYVTIKILYSCRMRSTTHLSSATYVSTRHMWSTVVHLYINLRSFPLIRRLLSFILKIYNLNGLNVDSAI
jgi:hypothetical protein